MEFMITSSKFISLFIKDSPQMINFQIYSFVMNTFYLYKFITFTDIDSNSIKFIID